MTDFEYDVRERARIARNARYKRNGSKSSYVPMRTDHMTQREINKLNGEVKVYKIGEKITWEEFKSYPVNIQREYLEKMVSRFGVTPGMLCEMFSIVSSTLYTHRQKHYPDLEIPKGATKRQIDSFKKWLTMGNETAVEEIPEVKPEPVVVEQKPERERVPEPPFINTITSGTFELTGRAVDISQTLFRMFQDTKITLKMDFFVLNEEEEKENNDDN